MSEPFGRKKTPGLAITSLVLGILGFVCCGLFSGIPAIICGHIAHGKIRRHPRRYDGAGLALTGLILGYLSLFSTAILSALYIPAVAGALAAGQATQKLSDAKQIDLAIQQMVQDGKNTGDKSKGYPADAGITTASELKTRLIKGGYLTEENATQWHFDDFKVGNVSASDPANTIILLMPASPASKLPVVFHLGGDGRILHRSQVDDSQEPPRDPPYLAP